MLQLNVAVQSIDEGVILAPDGSATRRPSRFKIRDLDGAMRFDFIQCSPEVIVRGQIALNAPKNTQVRALEFIRAGDWRLPRLAGVPRSEMSTRLDFPGRQRIQEGHIVGESILAANLIERQGVNLKA